MSTETAAEKTRNAIKNALAANPKATQAKLAEIAGVAQSSVSKWLGRIRAEAEMDAREETVAEVPELPSEDMPIDELLKQRREVFLRKQAADEARRLIPVSVKLDGPIGITWFGDPHLDDDGCNLPQLEADVRTVKATKGMLAGNIGDTNNNWVGRLMALWANQSTTGKQAWQMVEWFVKEVPWLVFLGGNHGAWSGSGDPLQWMLSKGGTISDDMQARFELRFPNGNASRIFARHDFPGHSQWNATHGMAKAATMAGYDDSILIAGHKHTTGYQIVKNPKSGVVSHLARAGGYKAIDKYAHDNFFTDHNFGESVVTVIDPRFPVTSPRHVSTYFNVEQGAEFLKFLRHKGGSK
jgi:transcriptional regulator with XRE-family HTH domain